MNALMRPNVDWTALLASPSIQHLIALAIDEDLGSGDVTSLAIFASPRTTRARLVARSRTVVCGLPLARALVQRFDGKATVTLLAEEGSWSEAGAILAEITGDVRALLGVERVLLNFLMRLCGIASLARSAVELVPPKSACRIYDTRKTIPGWRALDKAAVATGGACNHRMGLYDAVLIKDNHLAAAGSIRNAIQQVRDRAPEATPIEVEVDRIDQLEEALAARADIVLLDNFDIAQIKAAVAQTRGRAQLEVSGGVRLSQIPELAATGVDRISLGMLTHSALPADLAIDFAP